LREVLVTSIPALWTRSQARFLLDHARESPHSLCLLRARVFRRGTGANSRAKPYAAADTEATGTKENLALLRALAIKSGFQGVK
jgi:hypothetical protein